MDERLEKALEFANFRHTLAIEKKRLQEKLKSDLTIAQNGGIFYIDRNFLGFLNFINESEPESAVVLDDREVPVLIEDFPAFRLEAIQKYFRVINQYYMDYEALKKKRTVKDLVGL
jgi:hypothetical protein